MKGSIIKKIIIAVVIVAMLIPVFMEMEFGPKFEIIEYSELDNVLKETKQASNSFGFALAYISPSSDVDSDITRESVQETLEMMTHPATQNEPLKTVFIDYDTLSDEDKTSIFGDSTDKIAYIFMANGYTIETVTGSLNSLDLAKRAQSYSGNGFSEDLINFDTIKDTSELKKVLKNKKEVSMIVFGSDDCFYCNQYKIMYNKLSKVYDISVNYMNLNSLNSSEMDALEDMNLMIPKECSSDDKESPMFNEEGKLNFGTPLTFFTKNKVVGCIPEYVDEAKLVTKMQEVGMIKIND